jgi:arginine decarboxylase
MINLNTYYTIFYFMSEEFLPKKFFLTSGKATSDVSELNAFHEALKKANISYQNIVSVSSIIPDTAVEISVEEGKKLVKRGEITFTVLSGQSGVEGQATASGVAYAWMKNKDGNEKIGIIVEDHGYKRERTITPDLIKKLVDIAEVEKLSIYSKENLELGYLKNKKEWGASISQEITSLEKLERECARITKEYSKYLLDNFGNYGKSKVVGFDDISEQYGYTVAAVVFIL